MNLQEHLRILARQAKSKNSNLISADEAAGWPNGRLDELIEMGVLIPTHRATSIRCPGCSERCPVKPTIETGTDGQVYIEVVCRQEGKTIEISPDSLKQWRISKDKLIELENREKPRSNIGGMSWQEVQIKAEALVNEKGYLGFDKLKEAVSCSEGTLRKVITEKSSKLKQAKEEYESISKTLKAVGLTAKVIATYETSSGPKLSDTEVDEILVEMLERIKQERPEMLEQTKEQLEKMNIDQKREFAKVYQRDYRNKKNSLKKAGPKKQHQYKKV